MRRWRQLLGVVGGLLMGYGLLRLYVDVPSADLVVLALWLVGVVVIHDGLLSPAVVGVGWAISRLVPARARRYLQAALIAGGLVTVIALPMIYRQGKQPPSKAILQQDFAGNLTVLLAVTALLSLLAYALRVAGDRRGDRSS